MKSELLDIRIQQCLLLAQASPCPRRKLAAMLVDPDRNVVLADAYNGGPRKAPGTLCRGTWCEREGLHLSDFQTQADGLYLNGKLIPQNEVDVLIAQHPPIVTGTRMERGCHHAEMNVICNAAARGVATQGAWLIIPAEPCMMCAKAIHHAGISKVILVEGGYLGGDAGVVYLKENGVIIEMAHGPKDPREG